MRYLDTDALGSGQQHRAETVIVVSVAIAVVRAEQPGVGAIARVAATPKPTSARVDEVGVIVAPGLSVARDRLVLFSLVQGMATTDVPGTDIVVVVLSTRRI